MVGYCLKGGQWEPFSRAGEIEAWGRGIERIITACKNDGFSTPEFRYDASGIWTTFKFEYPERATIQNDQKTTQKTIQNLMGQQQAMTATSYAVIHKRTSGSNPKGDK